MSNATGTCARCGRGLKDPESVERGFGPVCWARVQAEKGVIKRDEMLDRLKEQELFERGGVVVPKHTPGPWKGTIVSCTNEEFMEIVDEKGRLIADVWFDRKHEEPTCPPLEEAEANANLILAAPDLLKQLKNAKNMLEKYQGTVEYFEICQAIKKADRFMVDLRGEDESERREEDGR